MAVSVNFLCDGLGIVRYANSYMYMQTEKARGNVRVASLERVSIYLTIYWPGFKV